MTVTLKNANVERSGKAEMKKWKRNERKVNDAKRTHSILFYCVAAVYSLLRVQHTRQMQSTFSSINLSSGNS